MKRIRYIVAVTALALMMTCSVACNDKGTDETTATDDTVITEISILPDESEQTAPSEDGIVDQPYEILAVNDDPSHPSCMVTNTEPIIYHDPETGLDLEVTFYGTIIFYLEDGTEFSTDIRADVAQRVVNAFAGYVGEMTDSINYSDFIADYGYVEDYIDLNAADAAGVDTCFMTIGGISLEPDSQTAYDDARL